MKPKHHKIENRGLSLHVMEWGTGDRHVILLHGFLEHGRSWDRVARKLAAHFHVWVPDARGHGDSGWVGDGGYYYFQDYVSDLYCVVEAFSPLPVVLVGHSMGGLVSSMYTAAFPKKVRGLVSIEGVGPPNVAFQEAPGRIKQWIEEMNEGIGASPRVMPGREAAVGRLRRSFPRFSDEMLQHLAIHGTRAHPQGVQWKWDPLHRTRGPQPFYLQQAQAYWRKISCPTLLLWGEDSGFRYPEAEQRECIQGAELQIVPGAGHMVYHEQPEAFLRIVFPFIRGLYQD